MVAKENGNYDYLMFSDPYNIQELHAYIAATCGCMSLFDAPLHRNFFEASRAGGTTTCAACSTARSCSSNRRWR